MDLDDVIFAVFCAIDEALPSVTGAQRLRQRASSDAHDEALALGDVVLADTGAPPPCCASTTRCTPCRRARVLARF
jgi:hypothetical protein